MLEEVNEEHTKRTNLQRLELLLCFTLLYSHSSFVVDWHFEHAANCGDFIIINLWIKSKRPTRFLVNFLKSLVCFCSILKPELSCIKTNL